FSGRPRPIDAASDPAEERDPDRIALAGALTKNEPGGMMIEPKTTWRAACLAAICVALFAGCASNDLDSSAPPRSQHSIERTRSGIVVTPESGPAKKVRLEVISDHIIHVTAAPEALED